MGLVVARVHARPDDVGRRTRRDEKNGEMTIRPGRGEPRGKRDLCESWITRARNTGSAGMCTRPRRSGRAVISAIIVLLLWRIRCCRSDIADDAVTPACNVTADGRELVCRGADLLTVEAIYDVDLSRAVDVPVNVTKMWVSSATSPGSISASAESGRSTADRIRDSSWRGGTSVNNDPARW